MEKVIIPYINKVRKEINTPDQYAVVIFDAFSGHNSGDLNELSEENKILVVKVPRRCTNELQSMDHSVNI